MPTPLIDAVLLRRAQRLRVEALDDDANVTTLLFAADRLHERLNVPDTLKAQMSACVRAPMVLMSHSGRALCSVTGSSLDWHDALTGHSTDAHVRARFGPSDYASDRNGWRQSARALLLDELAALGLGERDLHGSVNLFTKVATSRDPRGTLQWVQGHAVAGDWVELRAEQDVVAVLCTSPHPLDRRRAWSPARVRLAVTSGPPPGADDASRLFRDESARALVAAGEVAA